MDTENLCTEIDGVTKNRAFLAAVGATFSCILLLKTLILVYRAFHFLFVTNFGSAETEKYGQWAVVTGGNSGIGRGYAHLLARRGTKILLVARNSDTLKSTARTITSLYGVECQYFALDLGREEGVYANLERRLRGLDVGILVHCAGIAGKSPCYFLEESRENVVAMLELHGRATVQTTRLVLSAMLAKNKGVIINLSSVLSEFPLPLSAVYSSCKAFMDRFGTALNWEIRRTDVRCQTLLPYSVDTAMIYSSGVLLNYIRFFVISTETFCQSAIKTVGVLDRTAGQWRHAVYRFLVGLLPRSLLWFISFRQSNDIRLRVIAAQNSET
ncbi:very-long-chain 3-oxoacyl-CoA reductase-like [Centruroides vittatus]|uniref:very-long-chain 3-oxoacyl-CoA reductase-like n=1 Tax=Centruroides vittatus TaxID=120091 RepID=UPI00350FC8E9